MPAIDPVWIWIALGAIALMVVVALIARGSRRARSAALRDQFGREYDHAVDEIGSRKRAERELVARTEEVNKYDIRPLNAGECEKYRREWLRVEQRFVERPRMAVAEADELVVDIMRVEGYPIGDFDKHAAHLSVTHPRVVEHYRSGHKTVGTGGAASTEDLRQAMLHYRALFEELIGDRTGDDVPRDVPRENEVIAPSRSVRDDTVDRDEKRM